MLLGTSPNVRIVVSVVFIACILIGAAAPLHAQSTVATGNIQGTITDTTGGVETAAKVTITNTDTGQTLNLVTSSSGIYNSGSLVPGNYSVRAQAQGFKTVEQRVVVRVGVVSGVNLTLEVGAANAVVEVNEQAVSVNTEQPSVQGVLNKDQIENLPVNGRNFLDLAQLEPGVQIQDALPPQPIRTLSTPRLTTIIPAVSADLPRSTAHTNFRLAAMPICRGISASAPFSISIARSPAHSQFR
jgi:hypothetical protein